MKARRWENYKQYLNLGGCVVQIYSSIMKVDKKEWIWIREETQFFLFVGQFIILHNERSMLKVKRWIYFH